MIIAEGADVIILSSVENAIHTTAFSAVSPNIVFLSNAVTISAYSGRIPVVRIETLFRITTRTNEFVATNTLSPISRYVPFAQLANLSDRHDCS